MPTSPAPRSRSIRRLLTVLLVLLPLAELLALFGVSRLLGGWWTVALMMTTAIVGGLVIRREGMKSWRAMREATRSGALPDLPVADSGLILIGGFLLVLPGLITDAVGLLLLLPFTRRLGRAGAAYLLATKVSVPLSGVRPGFAPRTRGGPGRSEDRPGAGTTVQGDVIE